jgi:hypothetical protein
MAKKSKSKKSDQPPPIPPAIDLAFLEAAADNNLEYLVFGYVDAYVFAEPKKFREALAELPKGWRFCWFLTDINYQVLNGGFNQFFSNSSGEYALETLEALVTVGAKEAAKILKKAIDVFEKKFGRPADSRERMGWEPRDDPAIDALDIRFMKLAESGGTSFVPYLRKHPEQFVHAPAKSKKPRHY